MKILIASDSHGLTGSLYRIIDTEHPDMLIHLGDIEDDPGRLAAKAGSPGTPCVFIRGNCDSRQYDDMTGTVLRDEAVFPLCGHRFFCCHGHRYHVNYGIQTLSCAAYEKGCDIALYGHTHIPYDSFGEAVARRNGSTCEAGNIRILNPGSTAIPRGGSSPGYMIMMLDSSGRYSVELRHA